MMPGMGDWSATVRWVPHPRADETTITSTDSWLVKRQARLWTDCPGALTVTLTGPDGTVAATWERDSGWVESTAVGHPSSS